MLEMKGVFKTFNPNTLFEKKALVDINLKVEDGEFISIIGANGAGKSTLFNAISGSFLTDKGKIVLDGEDITAEILIDGKDPSTTPVRTFDNGTATVNTETAAELGYDFDNLSTLFAPFCTKVAPITTAESFSDL